MYLSDGQVGKKYIIECIFLNKKIKNRLQALGLTKGLEVKLANKNLSQDIVIKVRGTKLAISKEIANAIRVKKVL